MSQANCTTTKRTFKHLSETERGKIDALNKKGFSLASIAYEIGRNKSTIYREIQRGTVIQRKTDLSEHAVYFAETGQLIYEKNRLNCGAGYKMFKDPGYVEYLEETMLSNKWGPDTVLGNIQAEKKEFKVSVTAKTIYNYIDAGLLKVKNIDLHLKVRRKPKKESKPRIHTSKGTSIEERPLEANSRQEFGNWEIDLVIGTKSGSTPVLLTMNERQTRETKIYKLQNKSQDEVTRVIDALEINYAADFHKIFKSITSDNGREFLDFEAIETSKLFENTKRTKMYYAHPYSSFERGTNENINGMIRRFIPKGTDLTNVSEETISRIQNWINTFPRKILGYKSSDKLFKSRIEEIIQVV